MQERDRALTDMQEELEAVRERVLEAPVPGPGAVTLARMPWITLILMSP